MFSIRKCALPGVCILSRQIPTDERGDFVKTFNEPFFRDHGFPLTVRESFCSTSVRGVIRGMHFQLPPADHEKLVCCISGCILDAVVDLRMGSPTYGHHETIELSSESADCIYIPKGFAHGFFVHSETATVLYYVSTPHAPGFDSGVHWDSVGIAWPTTSPILSARDKSLTPLNEFTSPFRYAS